MVVFEGRRGDKEVIKESMTGPRSKVSNYKYDCKCRWNNSKALDGRSFLSVGGETVEKASGGPGAVNVSSQIQF